VRNVRLGTRTVADIDGQVAKVFRGLGNPEPPLDLRAVRELLKLDRGYYSTMDDRLLQEIFSRLKVAGRQVLLRPTILRDAVRSLSLKALYLPDQKRILLDKDLPRLKHRWNEAHEIGHDLIPWHAGMMLGDTEQTLTPACHQIMEAEANYAAGQLLFLADRFRAEATATTPSLDLVRALSKGFGNTLTSTLWRFAEEAHGNRPMVALVTGHPHPAKRKTDFDATNPCRYCVESPPFRERFGGMTETQLFEVVAAYSGAQRGGSLGEKEVVLQDRNGEGHVFAFETFFNGHDPAVHARPPRRGDSVCPQAGRASRPDRGRAGEGDHGRDPAQPRDRTRKKAVLPRTYLGLAKDAPLRRAVQRSGTIVTTPILLILNHSCDRTSAGSDRRGVEGVRREHPLSLSETHARSLVNSYIADMGGLDRCSEIARAPAPPRRHAQPRPGGGRDELRSDRRGAEARA
jgi:hypothetical protein